MFAIKQVPVIKSPSNCTVPTEDSWLQTDFTPVPSGRISLNLFFTDLVCCSPCCDKQLQITYSITLGTAPRVSQHSNPCRHSPNSSLPCRHNGNCWGFPNTRAPPMHARATSSYKGTSQPSHYTAHGETSESWQQHTPDLGETESFMGESTGFIIFTSKAFVPLQDCCSLTKPLRYTNL